MPKRARGLNAKSIETLPPGMIADGNGLYLQVTDKGARSWIFRFQRAGKRHDMGLGPTYLVGLAEARRRTLEMRRALLEGIDPLARKRSNALQAAVEQAKNITFREAADEYFKAHRDGWRSAHHAKRWQQSLAQHVHPTLGDLPVRAIDVGIVMRVLQPIWKTMPESASRIRGRIESVLDWTTVHGYREGDNPARWRGHLDKLLPRVAKVSRVQHHTALPYSEIGAFMAALRARNTAAARALEFLILTAARPGEAVGARWSEINVAERLWIVPADRMKAHREHRVPLSDAAMAVIEQMAAIRDGDFVFPGRSAGTAVSHTALSDQLPVLGFAVTAHGFRSTFRDWAAERTNFPNEVCEMALAHAVADRVEAAYRRGDLFQKRRQIMDAWARFCAAAAPTAGVVPLHAAAR
jgi:integrase